MFDAVLDEDAEALPPDYNIAPTDPVHLVRMSRRRGRRLVAAARWGLVPSWATDARGAARMINARAETLVASRAYGPAFGRRRCLVPADGWYEWAPRPVGAGRQPYFMTAPTGVVFAGLWAVSNAGQITCSIVTTAAVGSLSAVHDRMPLMLTPDRWADWLTAAPSPGLLEPPAVGYLESIERRPVGPAVGDVRNDGPGLVAPVADPGPVPVNLTLF